MVVNPPYGVRIALPARNHVLMKTGVEGLRSAGLPHHYKLTRHEGTEALLQRICHRESLSPGASPNLEKCPCSSKLKTLADKGYRQIL